MEIKKEKSVKGKTKKLVTKKRKQLKDATMDDFFNQTFEDEINGNDNNEQGTNEWKKQLNQVNSQQRFYIILVQNIQNHTLTSKIHLKLGHGWNNYFKTLINILIYNYE